MGTKSNTVNHLHCPCCCYYLRILSRLAMWHLEIAAAPSHAAENIPETRTRPPLEPPPSPLPSPQPLSLEEGISCHPTSCSGNCTSHSRKPHLSAFQRSASCLSHHGRSYISTQGAPGLLSDCKLNRNLWTYFLTRKKTKPIPFLYLPGRYCYHLPSIAKPCESWPLGYRMGPQISETSVDWLNSQMIPWLR